MSHLNYVLYPILFVAFCVTLFISIRRSSELHKLLKSKTASNHFDSDVENGKFELEELQEILTKDRTDFETEKKKNEEKNRKVWQMSEAIYIEKERVEADNEALQKEKLKLESEKKKFEEKNKKLWSQSIAIFKEKDRIELLKKDIEEKHHNVTESIRYAKRIQEAILPSAELTRHLLPQSFILYKPKDIVSGDFYWIESANNNDSDNPEETVLFSVVDCTGHGVPGAFMSIFGFNMLNQALDEHNLTRPSEIIDFLNNGVSRKLRMHNDDSSVKDGMDLVLCAFHKNRMKLEYAGVHNPLYLVRGDELIQFKADKHSIGDPFNEEFPAYNNYEIELQKDDMVYIFSDGLNDQFGGPEKRKFMSKRLRETLLEIRHLSMEHQKTELASILDSWMEGTEQNDDITLMGVKI